MMKHTGCRSPSTMLVLRQLNGKGLNMRNGILRQASQAGKAVSEGNSPGIMGINLSSSPLPAVRPLVTFQYDFCWETNTVVCGAVVPYIAEQAHFN